MSDEKFVLAIDEGTTSSRSSRVPDGLSTTRSRSGKLFAMSSDSR